MVARNKVAVADEERKEKRMTGWKKPHRSGIRSSNWSSNLLPFLRANFSLHFLLGRGAHKMIASYFYDFWILLLSASFLFRFLSTYFPWFSVSTIPAFLPLLLFCFVCFFLGDCSGACVDHFVWAHSFSLSPPLLVLCSIYHLEMLERMMLQPGDGVREKGCKNETKRM